MMDWEDGIDGEMLWHVKWWISCFINGGDGGHAGRVRRRYYRTFEWKGTLYRIDEILLSVKDKLNNTCLKVCEFIERMIVAMSRIMIKKIQSWFPSSNFFHFHSEKRKIIKKLCLWASFLVLIVHFLPFQNGCKRQAFMAWVWCMQCNDAFYDKIGNIRHILNHCAHILT